MSSTSERIIDSVIITGPTCAIGISLCNLLLKENKIVYAVVHPGSKKVSMLPDGVKIVECDISDYSSLSDKISHADAFVHLAWAKTTGSTRNEMSNQIRNIQYSVDAVNVAHLLGCSIFIGAGSQAEYGRVSSALTPTTPCFPENGYGMAKLCTGEMTRVECEKYGIDHVWVRILSAYGIGDNPNSLISYVVRSFLNKERPELTKCEQIWDYIYSDDVANAFWLAMKRGKSGSIYPLGSGRCRPLSDYIRVIRDLIDPSLAVDFGAKDYSDKQVMHLEADIRELNKDTGWYPSVSFEEGIRGIVDYMKNASEIWWGGVILYDICIYLLQSEWGYAA